MTRAQSDSPVTRDPAFSWIRHMLPGCMLCLAATGIGYGISLFLLGISVLIITIVLGMLLINVIRLPDAFSPGIGFSAKKLLCTGIIPLGLKLPLTSIIDLDMPMLLVVACIIMGGMLRTALLGRLLRVPPSLSLLIVCGFSICGTAAVTGAARVTDSDDEVEEDTITAVALVVTFGALMIPLVPLVAGLLDLGVMATGEWAGGSTHGVTQVVAIGGVIGGGALVVAVVVELARVLLLASVTAVLNFRQRRPQHSDMSGRQAPRTKLPPIVPSFILGFLVTVLLRSFVALPGVAPSAGETLRTLLLAAAMFGLRCGVRIGNLLKVGLQPFGPAAVLTLLVAVIAHVGVALAG